MKCHTIHFLTKPDCPLCDRLKQMIRELAESGKELQMLDINIEDDPAMFKRFKHRIPLVIVGDQVLLEGRPSEEQVRTALASNLAK